MKHLVYATILALLVTAPVLAQQRVTVFRDLAWGDPSDRLGEYIRPGVNPSPSERLSMQRALELETQMKQARDFVSSLLRGKQEDRAYFELLRPMVLGRANEVHSLGPLPVSAIWYLFLDNRLAAVRVYAEDAKLLQDILNAKYGQPVSAPPGNLHFLSLQDYWETNDTRIFFAPTEPNGAMMTLMSRALMDEAWALIDAADEQAAREYEQMVREAAQTAW